jgi:hypothetical protein
MFDNWSAFLVVLHGLKPYSNGGAPLEFVKAAKAALEYEEAAAGAGAGAGAGVQGGEYVDESRKFAHYFRPAYPARADAGPDE